MISRKRVLNSTNEEIQSFHQQQSYIPHSQSIPHQQPIKRHAFGDISNKIPSSIPTKKQTSEPKKPCYVNVAAVAAQVVKERALKSSRLRAQTKSLNNRKPTIPYNNNSLSNRLSIINHASSNLIQIKTQNYHVNSHSKSSIHDKPLYPNSIHQSTKISNHYSDPDPPNLPENLNSQSLIKSCNNSRSSQDRLSVSFTIVESDNSNSAPKINNTVKIQKNIVPRSMPIMYCVDDSGFDRDPLMVAEYSADIYAYLRASESLKMPNPNYIIHQPELEWSMRAILVDWMVKIHSKFRLHPETLFLAVNYLDRFLSKKVISVHKLQLAGVVCLLIASKYEEIQPPRIRDWVNAVEGGYAADEILKAERFILSALGFDTNVPEPYNCIRRISKADGYQIGARTVAKYLLEIALLDEVFLRYNTSCVSAACMFLGLKVINNGEWTKLHQEYSGYLECNLLEVVYAIMNVIKKTGINNSNVYLKYKDVRYMNASVMVENRIKNW